MTVHVDLGQRPPRPSWRDAVLAVARGLWAVFVLLATAVDALVTAWLGVPPLAWLGRRIGRVIADEYRRGYHNARDAEEVLDDDQDLDDSGGGSDRDTGRAVAGDLTPRTEGRFTWHERVSPNSK